MRSTARGCELIVAELKKVDRAGRVALDCQDGVRFLAHAIPMNHASRRSTFNHTTWLKHEAWLLAWLVEFSHRSRKLGSSCWYFSAHDRLEELDLNFASLRFNVVFAVRATERS